MKKVILTAIMLISFCTVLFAQAPNSLESILIYQGESAGTGTGLGIVKLGLGEKITVTAKGVDADGNEVCMAPTWKSDQELHISPVEGKGKTVEVTLKESPSLMCFFEVVVEKKNGEKVTGQVTVQEKKEE